MSELATIKAAFPFLERSSRGMHRRICAAPGAGKTTITARLLLVFDLLAGLPIVAIDPVGALSNDFLDEIDQLPAWMRRELEGRIRYVNMAGMAAGDECYLYTFPFLYRSGEETLYTVAHRYLDVLVRTWPSLRQSPILGEAAVVNTAENVLMALCAMGCQITEAEPLLRNIPLWRSRLEAAAEREPEAAPAIDWLLHDYDTLLAAEKKKETLSFFRRISMFRLDPSQRAIYGAGAPSFTPQEVVDQRLCVILDYRNMRNKEQRKLGILWMYHYFNDYFRDRGPEGRENPIAFYIDELSYLLPPGKKRDELIADDLSELFSRTARNNGIWVTVIHQDLQQFDEDTNVLLSRLGTQVVGASSDVKAAAEMAERFFRYDKLKVKAWENVWASTPGAGARPHFWDDDPLAGHFVIDQRPIYETAQEQVIENAYRFLDLEAFHFLVGVAEREGQLPTSLRLVSFADYADSVFGRPKAPAGHLDRLRSLLMQRHGQPRSEILAQVAGRLPQAGGAPRGEPPVALRAPARARTTRRSED